MERDIKFRAWDNWEFKYFDFDLLEDRKVYVSDENCNSVVNCKVMQYTWLKDKNWKEIYEGDILKYINKTKCKWDDLIINQLVFNKTQHRYWIWKGKNCGNDINLSVYLTPNNCKRIEIIWNIYENPELKA